MRGTSQRLQRRLLNLILAGLLVLGLNVATTSASQAAAPTQEPALDPVAAVVDGPTTNYVVPPDGGQTAPYCGTLYITSTALYYGPIEVGRPIRGIEYRVVGVDLGRWLGYPSGIGLLEVYQNTASGGTDYMGAFSASTQSGARTGVLRAPWVPGQRNPTVTAFIEKNGNVKCKQYMTVYPPGAEPA